MGKLSKKEETEIIKKVQSKSDTNSFGLLVDEYEDMVYNFCFRFFGNSDDAFDCSQEIFIRAFQHIESFIFRSKFSTWLCTIMHNTCINSVKSKGYRNNSMNASFENISNTSKEVMNQGKRMDNPERVLLDKELSEKINNAINTLNSKSKSVLLLRDFEDKTYEEIARITEMNIGTVKSRLVRARIKVANELKKYIHHEV
jgi:RNA polymerase sigma-70 factor (ECF subfamily)